MVGADDGHAVVTAGEAEQVCARRGRARDDIVEHEPVRRAVAQRQAGDAVPRREGVARRHPRGTHLGVGKHERQALEELGERQIAGAVVGDELEEAAHGDVLLWRAPAASLRRVRRGLQATLLMRLDLLVTMLAVAVSGGMPRPLGRKASGARIRDHQGRALRALDHLDDRLAW
jgi:hypothetical protein